METRPTDFSHPRIRALLVDELLDYYLTTMFAERSGVSTLSLPLTHVRWLLLVAIGVSGDSQEELERKLSEKATAAKSLRIYKPTDPQE